MSFLMESKNLPEIQEARVLRDRDGNGDRCEEASESQGDAGAQLESPSKQCGQPQPGKVSMFHVDELDGQNLTKSNSGRTNEDSGEKDGTIEF